jgi:hypothetical protein
MDVPVGVGRPEMTPSRWFVAVALAVVVAACQSGVPIRGAVGPTPTSTAVPTAAATVAGPPVSVSGAAKTGVSKAFRLAGGSYTVAWTVAAPKGGCYFFLFLATKANGPTIEGASGILTSGGSRDGTEEWTGVPAGTYVLQEDRSGLSNCRGAWSATVTPH